MSERATPPEWTSRGPAALPDDLRQWIGREGGPVHAAGPIEWTDVRRYMNAAGDLNPLWGEADLTTNPSRTGALAPPAMILDVLRPVAGADVVTGNGGRPFPSLGGLAATVPVAGEVARLNAGTEIEWLRPLRIGDWISVRFRITDVQLRRTAEGPAVFITEERRYDDRHGDAVAIVRQTTVRRLAADGSSAGAG
jgi:acyl dehydratase